MANNTHEKYPKDGPPATASEQSNRVTDTIDDRLSRVKARISALRLANRRYPRSSSRHRNRQQNSNLCYYHPTFEDQARNYRNPCSWTQGKRNQPRHATAA